MGNKATLLNHAGILEVHKLLIFIPRYDSPGKKDVRGAFRPEAESFRKLCMSQSRIVEIDNRLPFPKRRIRVLESLFEAQNELRKYDSVAFFCHGWRNGIQLGFTKQQTGDLAASIFRATSFSLPVVPLYCCSTGEDPQDSPITAAGTGDGSFADALRDELCRQGAIECRVMAHTTVAHTTSNPNVLFMDGMGSHVGGSGGYTPVSPKSELWSEWKRALRERSKSTLRFRMPYMGVNDIHEELSA